MFDRIAERFKDDAVQVLLDLGRDVEAVARPVDRDGQPGACGEGGGLLAEPGDDALFDERLGSQLEDEDTHLRQGAPRVLPEFGDATTYGGL